MDKTSVTGHQEPDLFLPLEPGPDGPPDFVFVTGDAYVDHPSFGAALLGRLLQAHGYTVGIIAQPDWRSIEDFRKFGKPRYGFLVSAGNMDSMVANYTVARKPRRRDVYSPGGRGGNRPDRATLVYCTRIREAFKNVDIVIGGIEASLRRFAHYDWWSDRMRRSILMDSKADILVYGMGETTLIKIASEMKAGRRAAELTEIPGTVWKVRKTEENRILDTVRSFSRQRIDLPSWDIVQDPLQGKTAYAESFRRQYRNTDPNNADILVEEYGPWRIVQNPPAPVLEDTELDRIYELPYTRTYHPAYIDSGGVPAVEEVRFSLVAHRGCFGGCSFCALTFHQGRRIGTRTRESLVREATAVSKLPGFKGYIHDLGGPTANFHVPSCTEQRTQGVCKDRECLFPSPCSRLSVSHGEYLCTLRELRKIDGVKKVFVRSGIRFDYLMLDPDKTFFTELCMHHVSGQLKVAPEHVSRTALLAMGKPGSGVYEEFAEAYKEINRKIDKKQFLVPYFISSHPGTTLENAIELAEFMRDHRVHPEQVQDFYPTPGTVSTCMYYTGIDPRNGKKVYVPHSHKDRAAQRALLQYRKPENYNTVRNALEQAGRSDLTGSGKTALIPDRPPQLRSTRVKAPQTSVTKKKHGGRFSRSSEDSGWVRDE
jgi:uncharacterized radical SAM protein YgiQ